MDTILSSSVAYRFEWQKRSGANQSKQRCDVQQKNSLHGFEYGARKSKVNLYIGKGKTKG